MVTNIGNIHTEQDERSETFAKSRSRFKNERISVLNYILLQGAAQKYTQFTGNKAPCSNKECVLIYDTKTKEFTIERLQTNIILKKSR
jgi:hypothetical protein